MPTTGRRRPTVLVFAPYYEPAFRAGGPVRTLRNMVDLLGGEVDFRIFTRAHDLGSAEPLPGVVPGTWIERDGARVFYGEERHRSAGALVAMVRGIGPDVVYLNSFLDASSSVYPLLLRRAGLFDRDIEWLLAPRGEFAPGAMAIKRRRKELFVRLSGITGLHTGIVWHASTDHEAADIRRVMGRVASEIRVAPNPTASVDPLGTSQRERKGAALSVCFLSRISPKKNLRYAIDVVKRVRRPVTFVIYGPAEDAAYWRECKLAMSEVPRGSTIEWRGELPPERVRETLARHDVFLFPTHGENFGHVIFEALVAGVPVLVSDQTPWRDLEKRGSGWVRSLNDPQGFVEVLEAFADRRPEERESARRAAHAHAVEVSRSEAVLEANRRLFLGRRPAGAAVLS